MITLRKLEKSYAFWFLLGISLVFFFLRFPSLFEPNWYGDEGIYQVLGDGMSQGRLLYRDIFDNKPPFLYILYNLTGSDLFTTRLLSLVFGLFSVVAFYFLSKKLFINIKSVIVSTSIFAFLFGFPVLEGNIANAENFILLPVIIAGLFILSAVEKKNDDKNLKILFSSGLLLGIAFLFKIVSVFDFLAFLSFLVIISLPRSNNLIFIKKNLLNEARNILAFVLGFIFLIIPTGLIFFLQGGFDEFLRATLFSNIGYVGYGNRFLGIPQGLLIFKSLILLGFTFVIFLKRIHVERNVMFIFIWVAFSIFNALFSHRPYTHYLIVLIPSFSLLIGLLFVDKWKKTALVFVFVTLAIVFNVFTPNFKKALLYYPNFVSFVMDQKTVREYYGFFDGNTPKDYLLSEIIKMNTNENDNIFIWGNNAQVYNMTNTLPPGKYAVAYHITNYKDGLENTRLGLERTKPKLIILMPNTVSYPFSLEGYEEKLMLDRIQIYERTF